MTQRWLALYAEYFSIVRVSSLTRQLVHVTRPATTDSMSTPSSSTAPFWEQAWKDAQPALDLVRASLSSLPAVSPRILRVGQLDAELLDQELIGVLKEPVNKALGQIKVCFPFDPHLDPQT